MNQKQAGDIVRQAWARVWGSDPTDSEVAYTQAVAWGENQYGRAGQFAALAAVGKYNWGSLHAGGSPPSCPAGSAPGSDVGKVCFRVYPSDVDAATAFVRELTQNAKYGRERVKAAMSGSAEDVAQAMFDSQYYQGSGATPAIRVQNYANLIRRSLATIAAGGGVPEPTPSRGGGSSSSAPLVLAALAAGGAYWLFYRGGLGTVTRYARRVRLPRLA